MGMERVGIPDTEITLKQVPEWRCLKIRESWQRGYCQDSCSNAVLTYNFIYYSALRRNAGRTSE